MFRSRREPSPTIEAWQQPTRRLLERNVAEEDIPAQARPVWASLDEQVGIIAVLIHNMVLSPATAQPWSTATGNGRATVAFAKGRAMAQQEAADLSQADDEQYLRHTHQADEYTDLAGSLIENTEQIIDETVEFPPGSRVSGRIALIRHHADGALALERERAGDSRHRKRAIERYWVLIVAAVLAALDILLLWRPLLNLGELNSAGALYKWMLALAFAGAQALSIDLAIHRYREQERTNRELRDAVKDHNRAARRGLVGRDLAAVTRPPVHTHDLEVADDHLHVAYRWLLATAAGVGAIGVFRVAFLSRGGGQSILEATLFGAFVGMVLGALVLLLGVFVCRGNRLGDRLRAGAQVVAAIEDQLHEGVRQVGEARDDARLECTAAEDWRARADDTRNWVIGQYWQAVVLAATWLGLQRAPLGQNELVVPRRLAIAEAAEGQMRRVLAKLEKVDRWLAAHPLLASAGGTAVIASSALGPAAAPLALSGRVVGGPPPGGRGGLVPVETTVTSPQSESRWLLAVAGVAAVVLAFVAALSAPTPEFATAGYSAGTPTPASTAVALGAGFALSIAMR